jgi:hypothetical protein
VKGERKRENRHYRSQEFTHQCARNRPTPQKKGVAAADLVRDSQLTGSWRHLVAMGDTEGAD